MRIETIDLTWSDLKSRLMACLDEGKPWRQAQGSDLLAYHRAPYAAQDWAMGGHTPADLLGWLREGFYAPELAASGESVLVESKPRPAWSEEDGDVDLGRLYGGYDDFYLAVGESQSKPGLTIRIDLFFAASVHASTIKSYGAWLAGLIGTLESQGVDLQIELVLPVRQLYNGATGRQDVRIAVKQLGELSDFTEWSACFSPASTRVLMFTAFGVASEKVGKQQTNFMSYSLEPHERTWGAEYDAEGNVLTVTAAQRARNFPAETMTAKVREAGLI